eukprot:scaffold14409_cov49-Phaeocystis_antarctica.AAC.3
MSGKLSGGGGGDGSGPVARLVGNKGGGWEALEGLANKHDTGWARGAPCEDHTTPPPARNASGSYCWGGAAPALKN